MVLTGVAAVLVNLGDGDLDGGVVVGLDDAVGGAALAGDVAVIALLAFLSFWRLRMCCLVGDGDGHGDMRCDRCSVFPPLSLACPSPYISISDPSLSIS